MNLRMLLTCIIVVSIYFFERDCLAFRADAVSVVHDTSRNSSSCVGVGFFRVFDQHECKMFKLHFASALDFFAGVCEQKAFSVSALHFVRLFGQNAFCVGVGFFPELLVETKKIRAASYITSGAPSFWSKQILRRRWIFPGV